MNKKIYIILCCLLAFIINDLTAGGIVNKGAVIKFSSSAAIKIEGDSDADFVNKDDASTGSLGGTGTLYLEGDWTNSSSTSEVFSDSVTVNFNGSNQVISGSTTFVNLTKNVSSSATLTFPSTGTTTITGTMNLQGSADQLLKLRSDSEGTQWQIDPQDTRTISYLDVMDSNNINSESIDAIDSNCTDSGNNTKWTFTETTYILTVNKGSGGGSYTSGTTVAIAAKPPKTGQVFSEWTGDIDYVTNVNSSSTTVTMPSQDISITATYTKKDKNTKYNLIVNNGIGSGSYSAGTIVPIIASVQQPESETPPTATRIFYQWTGDTANLENVKTISTLLTMPAEDVSITASYKVQDSTYYTMTVNNGSGSGSYRHGTPVIISANSPNIGQVFDRWTGAIDTIQNPLALVTTVTMPEQNINVTPIYKDATKKTYQLRVKGGTGGGRYRAGQHVTITAKRPPEGKVFDSWSGPVSFLRSTHTFSTVVTIPEESLAFKAKHKDADDTEYLLNVTNGSGSGNYTAGTNIKITANDAETGYEFSKWIGDISFLNDPLSSEAFVSMPEQAIIMTAVYEIIEPELTVAALNNQGSATPNGYLKLSYGETVSLSATANAGNTFESWKVIGDAVIYDRTSATTQITVYNNCQVMAKFSSATPQDNKASLRISRINKKENADHIKLSKLPLSFTQDSFDPAHFFTVNIDGDLFKTRGYHLKTNSKDTKFTYTSPKGIRPKIIINMDFQKGTLDFYTSTASLQNLDDSDGIACTLWPDNKTATGVFFDVEKKCSWNFDNNKNKSEVLTVTGTTMEEFAINKAFGKLNSTNEEKNHLNIAEATYNLAQDVSFDYTRDDVIVKIDDYTFTIPAGSFVLKNAKKKIYDYMDQANGVKMTLNQSLKLWMLDVSNSEIGKVDLTNGLDIYLKIGAYESGINLSVDYHCNYKDK